MPSDNERLQILIEGKVNDFEKSIKRVERQIDKIGRAGNDNMRKVQSASSRAARSIEQDFTRANSKVVASFSRLGGAAKGALAGFGIGVGAIGTATAIQGIRRAASEMASLGDTAEKVGITVEQLQALRIEFEKSGVKAGTLDIAMQRFSRRVGEAANGTGELRADLERMGIALNNADGSARPLIDIFAEYADGIQKAQSQQEALRLTFKAFDSEGAGMVNLLRQIGAGARDMANQFNGSPEVINSEDVRKAREIDAAFADMSRELDVVGKKLATQFGPALVTAARAISDIAQGFSDLNGTASDIRGELEKGVQLARTLDAQAQRAIGSMAGVGEATKEVAEAGSEVERTLEQQQSHVDQLAERLDRVKQLIALEEANGASDRLDRLNDGALRLQQYLEAAKAELLAMQGVSVQFGPPIPSGGLPAMPMGGNVSGLSSDFSSALNEMAAAAREAGHEIKVNSGFRSVERQAQLFEAAVRKYGSEAAARQWVAPPGRSNHNFGLAADLGFGSDAARQWAHDNASRFGLNFPLANENWHIEPMGPDGGRIRGANAIPQPADRREITAKTEQERLKLLQDQNAERERQQAAITAVNESLAQQLELAGLENELLSSGKFTLEEVNAALDQEQLVREKLNQLKSAGVEVTPQMEAAIRSEAAAVYELINANEQLVSSQERVNAKTEEMAQAFEAVGQPIVDTFLSILDGSAKAEDAIKSLIKQLAKMLIQGALFGSGPLGKLFGGGLFGSLFSVPGRAGGGPVSAGKPYIVGEKRPELFVPDVSGRIIPRLSDPMPAASGMGGSGGVHVTVGVAADNNGNLMPFVQSVAQKESRSAVKSGLTSYDRQMQGAPLLGRIDRAREKY